MTRFPFFVLTFLIGCSSTPPPRMEPPPQIEGTFSKDVVVRFDYKYLIALPPDFEKQENWPLVLFLHGGGECGQNLSKVKVHGPPKLAETSAYPFVLVSPQAPRDWDVHGLNALLDEIIAKYKIDQSRVYVTGMSLGGGATWDLCGAYPDRFAAAIPCCAGWWWTGWLNPDFSSASKMKNIAFWVFHGDKDQAVPVGDSQRMVEALKKAGNEAKLTIYPGVAHNCWEKAYLEPELWTWLLSHKK